MTVKSINSSDKTNTVVSSKDLIQGQIKGLQEQIKKIDKTYKETAQYYHNALSGSKGFHQSAAPLYRQELTKLDSQLKSLQSQVRDLENKLNGKIVADPVEKKESKTVETKSPQESKKEKTERKETDQEKLIRYTKKLEKAKTNQIAEKVERYSKKIAKLMAKIQNMPASLAQRTVLKQ